MRTACIIQARLNSTRLPRKVLLPLNGRTVIGEVVSRCKQIAGIDEVICAIPVADDDLATEAERYCRVVRGPEHDVLMRYVIASVGYTRIMRITADCPLLSPAVCMAVLQLSRGVDYCSNVRPRTLPKGLDCEVFARETLMKAHKHTATVDREHVTPWMQTGRDVRRKNFENPYPVDGRLTLDTEADYQVIRAAFDEARTSQRAA